MNLRNLKLLFGVLVLLFTLAFNSGCSSEKEKSVDEYAREAMTAMNEGDYATAYMVVDIMHNLGQGNSDQRDYSYSKTAVSLNQKIVNNEIAELFEEPDDPMLLSKINKIIRERFSDYEGKKNTMDMISDLSMEANRVDILEKMFMEKKSKKDIDYIEFIQFILNSNIEDRDDKVLQILSSYPNDGLRLEGLSTDFFNGNKYRDQITSLNNLLNRTLDLALSQKNFELADQIIYLYKEDVNMIWGDINNPPKVNGIKVDEDHCFITHSWKSREAAKKKLNEAKRNK